MGMTDEEKGYHCPDDCEHCEIKNTLCIVYSKEGKKKHMDWLYRKSKEAQEQNK